MYNYIIANYLQLSSAILLKIITYGSYTTPLGIGIFTKDCPYQKLQIQSLRKSCKYKLIEVQGGVEEFQKAAELFKQQGKI